MGSCCSVTHGVITSCDHTTSQVAPKSFLLSQGNKSILESFPSLCCQTRGQARGSKSQGQSHLPGEIFVGRDWRDPCTLGEIPLRHLNCSNSGRSMGDSCSSPLLLNTWGVLATRKTGSHLPHAHADDSWYFCSVLPPCPASSPKMKEVGGQELAPSARPDITLLASENCQRALQVCARWIRPEGSPSKAELNHA